LGIRDQAKRIAAGAGVALATSGLSNCNDQGAVDPPPPPLQCNSVGMGQTLAATATRTADTLDVNVRNTLGSASWQVDRVTAVSGATLLATRLPAPRSNESLDITLRLESTTTTQASFTVDATLAGLSNETCTVQRTFIVTISPTGVLVSLADADRLPLAARQRAEIVLAQRDGHVVEMQAKTPWQGDRVTSWFVSDGSLDASSGSTVHWTLPATPGIYQAELVIDFGSDGLAFDMLLLEVEG
jgi:hypothetical protein